MKVPKSTLLHILGHAEASLNQSMKLERRIPVTTSQLNIERIMDHVAGGGQIEIVNNGPDLDQGIPVEKPHDTTPDIPGGL